MFEVNNKDIRTTPGVSKLRAYSTSSSSVSIVNFEHVNAGWYRIKLNRVKHPELNSH